jgi:hypothetical protein
MRIAYRTELAFIASSLTELGRYLGGTAYRPGPIDQDDVAWVAMETTRLADELQLVARALQSAEVKNLARC